MVWKLSGIIVFCNSKLIQIMLQENYMYHHHFSVTFKPLKLCFIC